MHLPASRSACFIQVEIDCAVGSNSRASSSGVRPDRQSVAGTPADKRFGNQASGTSKINFKGVHQTGSTPTLCPNRRYEVAQFVSRHCEAKARDISSRSSATRLLITAIWHPSPPTTTTSPARPGLAGVNDGTMRRNEVLDRVKGWCAWYRLSVHEPKRDTTISDNDSEDQTFCSAASVSRTS